MDALEPLPALYCRSQEPLAAGQPPLLIRKPSRHKHTWSLCRDAEAGLTGAAGEQHCSCPAQVMHRSRSQATLLPSKEPLGCTRTPPAGSGREDTEQAPHDSRGAWGATGASPAESGSEPLCREPAHTGEGAPRRGPAAPRAPREEQRAPRPSPARCPRARPAPRPPAHLVAEGGSAQQLPQQPEPDVPAGALGDEVEVQHIGGAQAAVPQQRAQRRLRLLSERGAALRLGEHEQEVQPAGPRAGRGGRRGSQAAGGAGEGLAAAAQVVEGADGHGRGRRQGRGLRAAEAGPAPRAPQRRHRGAAPAAGPPRPSAGRGHWHTTQTTDTV